jgi:hypothetical protein
MVTGKTGAGGRRQEQTAGGRDGSRRLRLFKASKFAGWEGWFTPASRQRREICQTLKGPIGITIKTWDISCELGYRSRRWRDAGNHPSQPANCSALNSPADDCHLSTNLPPAPASCLLAPAPPPVRCNLSSMPGVFSRGRLMKALHTQFKINRE